MISIILFLSSQYNLVSNNYSISYNGFVVDESGNIYLGAKNEIIVYNNAHLYSIKPKTSRGYSFAIFNNKLLVKAGKNIYLIDDSGNETPINISEFNAIYNSLIFNSYVYKTETSSYKMSNIFGKTKIIDMQKNETIYEIDNNYYYSKLFYWISTLFFCLFVIYIIFDYKRNNQQRNKQG